MTTEATPVEATPDTKEESRIERVRNSLIEARIQLLSALHETQWDGDFLSQEAIRDALDKVVWAQGYFFAKGEL